MQSRECGLDVMLTYLHKYFMYCMYLLCYKVFGPKS